MSSDTVVPTEGMQTTEDEENTGIEIYIIIYHVSLYLRRRTISKKCQWQVVQY